MTTETTNRPESGSDRKSVKCCDNTYRNSKEKIYRFIDSWPLRLQQMDRESLEQQVAIRRKHLTNSTQRVEASCVNYLRHECSSYKTLRDVLNRPDGWLEDRFDRYVLSVEKRRAGAAITKRILDEIAEAYPWLAEECARQKERDGVGGNPGKYRFSFGPFRGKRLEEVDSDYMIQLLGMRIGASLRNRIERYLAESFKVSEWKVES